ncbi:hypothetical protein ACO0QE_003941 [Hanseniaspora vineae]
MIYEERAESFAQQFFASTINTSLINHFLRKFSWQPVFPDCNENLNIIFPSTKTFFQVALVEEEEDDDEEKEVEHAKKDSAKALRIFGSIYDEGFPFEFTNGVCYADDINTVTPMNLFLNKVFNSSEAIRLGVVETSFLSLYDPLHQSYIHDKSMQDPPFVKNILNPALTPLPIDVNFTLNSSDFLKEVGIDKKTFKIIKDPNNKRNPNSYKVQGQGYAEIFIPYVTDLEISVEKLKGETKIIDQISNKHFLTVTMDVWEDCKVEYINDDEDATSGATLHKDHHAQPVHMKLIFKLDDAEVEVVDSAVLGRVMSRTFWQGESPVLIDGVMDLIVKNDILGEFMLSNIPGTGSTVITR